MALIFLSCTSGGPKTESKVDSMAIFENQLKYHENSREDFINSIPSNMISSEVKSKLFIAKCMADSTDEIPKTSIHEKGTNNPFDLEIQKTTDTVHISFKVSNECCVEYFGGYTISNDSLLINFCSTSFGCDCYCDYKLEYFIPDKSFREKIKVIKVHE